MPLPELLAAIRTWTAPGPWLGGRTPGVRRRKRAGALSAMAMLPATCIFSQPLYNSSWSVEPVEWAKAHFFVAMKPEILSRIEEIAQRVAADCETISHQVGTILDVEDVVPGHYTLEVSSPGLERKLLKPRDFERFQGKKAKVTLRAPVENQSHWEGTLAGFADGIVSLDAAGRLIRFPFEQVQKANLKFEW